MTNEIRGCRILQHLALTLALAHATGVAGAVANGIDRPNILLILACSLDLILTVRLCALQLLAQQSVANTIQSIIEIQGGEE